MKEFFTVDEVRDDITSSITYTYTNHFKLRVDMGSFTYSNKLPSTRLHEYVCDEVELTVLYEDQILTLRQSNKKKTEALIPFCPISWVRWFHTVLADCAETNDSFEETREMVLQVYELAMHGKKANELTKDHVGAQINRRFGAKEQS